MESPTKATGPEEKLHVIKALVASGDYHYSQKVRNFIEKGCYEAADLEKCILTARAIQKVEPDETGGAEDGCKYTILGRDREDYPFYTCGKIVLDQENKRLYFFITAHEPG